MYHLPRYWQGSESGGRSGVSFPARLARYYRKSVSGGRSEATFLSHLPRYWQGSESGGRSGVSFPAHLPRYSSDAPPAAVFVEKRVRCAVRCTISLSPPLFSPPQKKSLIRDPRRPEPRDPAVVQPVAPPGTPSGACLAGLPQEKKSKKSPEKFGGSGKSSTFAIPFGKRGTREAPGREEKRRGSGSGRTSEVH